MVVGFAAVVLGFAAVLGFEVVVLGFEAVLGFEVVGFVSFFAVVPAVLIGGLAVVAWVLLVVTVSVLVVVAVGVGVEVAVVCTHFSSLQSPSNKSLQ